MRRTAGEAEENRQTSAQNQQTEMHTEQERHRGQMHQHLFCYKIFISLLRLRAEYDLNSLPYTVDQ